MTYKTYPPAPSEGCVLVHWEDGSCREVDKDATVRLVGGEIAKADHTLYPTYVDEYRVAAVLVDGPPARRAGISTDVLPRGRWLVCEVAVWRPDHQEAYITWGQVFVTDTGDVQFRESNARPPEKMRGNLTIVRVLDEGAPE